MSPPLSILTPAALNTGRGGIYVIDQSATPVPLTGVGADTEQVIKTVSFPGRMLGHNGILHVMSRWKHTSTLGSKVANIRFGLSGTMADGVLSIGGGSAVRDMMSMSLLYMRGMHNSEVLVGNTTSAAYIGMVNQLVNTLAVDVREVPVFVSFSASTSLTAETVTLAAYSILLLRPA